MFGRPKLDPRGLNRDAFRAAAAHAATLFFAEKDVSKCASTIERFSRQVTRKFGERHPDNGRALLFLAVVNLILKRYDESKYLNDIALSILETVGTASFDYRAAKALDGKLCALSVGEPIFSPQQPLIGDDPVGHFIEDLKPSRQ